jgi:signal transduction histidine kinase
MQNQTIIIQTFLISACIGAILIASIACLLYQNIKQRLLFQAMLTHQVIIAKSDNEKNILNNISKNIHDTIQPNLIYIRSCLSNLKSISLEEILEKTNLAYQMIGLVIKELRTLSKNINPNFILQNGFQFSINSYIKEINLISGLSAGLQTKGISRDLDLTVSTILFGIIKEAITNILKHSKASQILITLQFTSSNLTVVIEDNGIGFNVEEVFNNYNQNQSSGLKSMINKAAGIKSSFHLISNPGIGTVISINTPY